MTQSELTRPYVPHALLERVYKRLFKYIQVEEGWAEQARALSRQGGLLYILPNLNWLDFLALDYLTKKNGLPPLRYANDLGLWILNPDGPNDKKQGLLNTLFPHMQRNSVQKLEDALDQGGSAALFLKRPPNVVDAVRGASGGRGMREGDELVHSLLRMQREKNKPIILMPLVFVWTKFPDKLTGNMVDYVLGSRNYPSPTRAIGQFAANIKHVALRWGEPVHLNDFLEAHREVSDQVLVRRLTYTVLRRLERERRALVGPVEKTPERIRSEILRSPRLHTIISDLSHGNAEIIREKKEQAASMLAELQANPSFNVIKGLGVILRWGFNRIYRGIEFDPKDVERVREASRRGALVLLPSHKSHIDYLVLSYFFYERNLPMPLIAAGDNLNFQPIGPIFRRAGAFFIRRSFKGDRLYAAVVDAYIRRLIRDGYPLELFLEGARSRTGKLLEPKFGLLNMIVDAAVGVPQQTVYFVPISIGYERVVEADSYQQELSGGEKKKEEATDLLSASEVLRHRYGRINLQFGNILTLEDMRQELSMSLEQMERPAKRRAVVTRLGNRVMDEINRVTAVAPGSLTALTLLTSPTTTLSEAEICDRSARLLSLLQRSGARVTEATTLPHGSLRSAAIREALHMFVEAEMLVEKPAPAAQAENGPLYTVLEQKRLQLDTSKNIIVHFFVERALIASSLDRNAQGQIVETPLSALRERVHWASRLFKHEFRFRADAPYEEILKLTLDQMVQEGQLSLTSQGVRPGPSDLGWTGEQWMEIYRNILHAFFESYWIAAQSLDNLLSGPTSEKDLLKRSFSLGNELSLSKQVLRREAISKPVFSNAYHTFAEFGCLLNRGGKWELKDTFQTRGALDELAAAIFSYLSGHHETKP